MKKSKLLILGLIALMLAGGLVLASCGSKCPGGFRANSKGSCNLDLKDFSAAASYEECKDECISKQLGMDVLSMIGKKFSCDC